MLARPQDSTPTARRAALFSSLRLCKLLRQGSADPMMLLARVFLNGFVASLYEVLQCDDVGEPRRVGQRER